MHYMLHYPLMHYIILINLKQNLLLLLGCYICRGCYFNATFFEKILPCGIQEDSRNRTRQQLLQIR